MDYLLKDKQIVIEIKMTRPGLKAKEISNQLIIDIHRYQAHPDCKMLIAFVYDPDVFINNPRGVGRDLSKETDGMRVKVIINPY
jgi:REase_DpnII-MboI